VADRLSLVIRTPHEVVLDAQVRSARVPAASGHVGLRPREEPFVLVVEPGLVLLRIDASERFAATAGGLLDVGRERSVLYTPFAVVGERDADVLAALDRALATPDSELAARRRLGELEQHILQELRRRPAVPRPAEGP
jgi:F0F1-type ATP synthase epsilon subunit